MKFKDFDKQIIKDNVKYSVDKITEIIQTIGPRESGNESCYQAQELLRKDLEKYCDETHYEEYKMAPKAFTHFTKTVSAGLIGAIGTASVLKYAKGGNYFAITESALAAKALEDFQTTFIKGA